MNTRNYTTPRIRVACALMTLFFFSQNLLAQCTTNNTPDCNPADPYYQVVLSEFGGDAGQSDSVNDAIVELSGPANTNISGMVVTNTEWAVVLPPNSILRDPDGDGIGHYVLICEESPINSFTTNNSGLSCSDCDFPGLDVELNPTGNQVNGFNVCDQSQWGIYVSSSITTYNFTLDNGACGASLDGDQVILFQPDGTVQDAAYYGGPDMTQSNGGNMTVGGSSGNCGSPADHVSVQIAGISYTLGDNDDNGVVNDYTGTHIGFKGDGGNATGVNLMPSQDPDGDGVFSDEVCYTVPSLNDPIWEYVGFAPTSCNSTYIRMAGTDGSQGQGNGAQNPSHNNDPDLDADFGPETADTPSSCPNRTTWGYTDHPTPGFSNDVDVWDFYVFEGSFTTANLTPANELTMRTGIQEIFCNPGPVTFAVQVYNYQQVEPTITSAAKAGSFLFDGTTNNVWVLHQTGHSTATTSGGAAAASNDDGITTLYYTVNVTGGVQNYTLVWDDFTNCCGSGSTSTVVGRAGTNNQNECYEDAQVQITVGEPITVSDNAIICPGDFAAGIGTIDFSALVTSPNSAITYELREGVTGGMEATTGTVAATNASGVFNLTNTLTPPFAVILKDDANCGADIVITIEDNCAEPPVCPEITGSMTDDADGNICPNQQVCFDITSSMDLADGSTIDYYFDTNAGFNPYAGEGTLLGSADVTVSGGGPCPTGQIYLASSEGTGDSSCGTGGEFIEICHAGCPCGTAIDLSGWEVEDAASDDGSPATSINIISGSLLPGECIVIQSGYLDGTIVGNPSGDMGSTFSIGSDRGSCPIWNSGGDVIFLYDGDSQGAGTLIDQENSTGGASTYTAPTVTCPTPSTNISQFCYTFDETFCNLDPSGDFTVKAIINPFTAFNQGGVNCQETDAERFESFTLNMTCPTADLTANTIDQCVGDGAIEVEITITNGPVDIVFNDGNGGTITPSGNPFTNGTFTVQIFDGNTPTSGEVSITLASVTATTGAMCTGTVDVDEVLISINPAPAATVTGSTDFTGCAMGQEGTITFSFTGNGPFDFTYSTPTGNVDVVGVASPYTITAFQPGNYDIVSVIDGNGCAGTVTSNVQNILPPANFPVATAQNFMACSGATTDLTTQILFDIDETGDGGLEFDDQNATAIGTIEFYNSDPTGLPPAVLANLELTGADLMITSSTSQTFFFIYENTTTGCSTIGSFDILISETPTATATPTQPVCPNGMMGSVSINLTSTTNGNLTDFEFAIVAGSSFSGTPTFADVNADPLTINSGTGTAADADGETYTIRVRNKANPTCFIDLNYTLTAVNCGSCPIIGALSDPADICVGSNFNITASGLDDMAMAQNGDMDFGIAFQVFNGGTAPTDAYTGGTNLGTVPFVNLTGADPNQSATLTNVGSALTTGTYQICSILSPIPTDGTCRPQECITLVVDPQDDPSFDYPNTTCQNASNPSASNIATPGGMFSVNNTATINATTGELDLSTTIAGTTYTITYQTNGACPNSTVQNITVQNTDDASFAYPNTVCDNAANPIATNIATAGGTFSVDNGATINGSTGELDLSTTTVAITYTITYLTSGVCAASSTQMITIQRADDASFDYPNTVCENAINPVATNIATAGGTFSVDNGATINGSTGELDLSTTTSGTTYTITYQTGSICPNSATQTIIIQAADDANFNYPTTVCENAVNPTATITGLAGGLFSVNNGATINATTGELDLSTTSAGTTYTITYQTNGSCPNSSTQNIAVQVADDASFAFPATVCKNATTNPTASNIATGGGTFSVDNGATINGSTGELDLSTTTEGTTYTITYQTAGTCPNLATQTISIQAVDNASFSYPNMICINSNSNPIANITGLTGGTFSINPAVTINASTGELDLSTTTAGTTYTITYQTNGTCLNSATQTISIQVADDASFNFPAMVCENAATNPTASIIGLSGGTFSVNNLATINASTGELDLSTTTAGTTYTITYQTNGTCPSSATQTILIQAADDASFTYPAVVCENTATNPTATITGLGGGIFSVNNGATINTTTGELDLSTTTGGTTYSITYSTNGSCPNSTTQMIMVQAADDASFDYPMMACMNGTVNPVAMNIATSGGTFSVNNGATINTTTGELDLSSTTQNTTYTITYQTNGTCPESSTHTISIGMTDDASFDFPTTACENDVTNPIASNIMTAGGTFSIDNGAAINISTGELDLTSTTAGTTYTITYTTMGTCANFSTQTILVQMVDDASFLYPADVCENTATNPTATITGLNGGTFSVDNGATITTTTGELDLSTTTGGTTYTITYQTNGACPNMATQTIDVEVADDASFLYPATICENTATNPTATITGLNGGTFSVDNGATINASTGELDLSTTMGGTTYTITYQTNGVCPNTSTQSITILTAPMATIALNGATSSCNGDPVNLDFTASGGLADYTITYQINDGNTVTTATVLVDNSGTATVVVNPTQTTTYTLISVENNESCLTTVTGAVTITIIENPVVNNAELLECENGGGAVLFELNAAENDITGGVTGVSVSFHATMMAAQMNQNPLPNSYSAVPGTVVFARVTDDVTGCFSIAQLTLNGFACTIEITDPCSCLDNATTQDDGQFSDRVIVTAPAGETWFIQSVNGLFDPMIEYPNPIPAGVPYALSAFQTGASGELLVEVPTSTPGISNYYLQGVHVDGLGYSIAVTNGASSLSVPNGNITNTACFYPELFLTVSDDLLCVDDAPISISFGEINGTAGSGILFLDNQIYTGTTIDPTTLTVGLHELRYDFNAGMPVQGDANDPGCLQSISITFEISNPNVILCRPPVNTNADADLCGANLTLIPPIVLNENTPVSTVSSDAPAILPVGTTVVTWTVTDINGCDQTCTQNVTINDNTPPTIDCGQPLYAGTSWTNCGYPSSLLMTPAVSDNCGILSVTNDAPAFFPPGMYMPTWTVTDVNGNSASCMVWVNISDTTDPKITSCPSNISVTAQSGNGATVSWTLPEAMDNCPDPLIWVSSHHPGDLFPLGTTTVSYTVYDQYGNTDDCSFDVTVLPIAPLISNPTNTAQAAELQLLQNIPNPFIEKTTIVFSLPKESMVTLTVRDLNGRTLLERKQAFTKGRNEVLISKNELGVRGVLIYELRTKDKVAVGKMIAK